MAQIDELREIIGYFKIFFTIILASVFALTGWLLENCSFTYWRFWIGLIATLLLVILLFLFHKIIMKNINILRRL
jgi:hypothetical protein